MPISLTPIIRRKSLLKFPPMEVTWDERPIQSSSPHSRHIPMMTTGRPHKLHKEPPKKILLSEELHILPPAKLATYSVGGGEVLARSVKKKKSLSHCCPLRMAIPKHANDIMPAQTTSVDRLEVLSNGSLPDDSEILPLSTTDHAAPSPVESDDESWQHHESYYPEYSPIIRKCSPSQTIAGTSSLAELHVQRHAHLIRHSVAVHYPKLPTWEEYNPGAKGDKAESGWKTGIYGVGGWSEYE